MPIRATLDDARKYKEKNPINRGRMTELPKKKPTRVVTKIGKGRGCRPSYYDARELVKILHKD